ncbi:MAG: GNAT family N-acetyltransferase [Hyphomicrobiaceae bacterium]|nr:GNAT family N-acetyltransferase [Hyphomicrobiaceae bacterium]
MIEIREARFPQDRHDVERLFRAYAASLSIDLCFQGFEEEVAQLPGAYAPPGGVLLVAQAGGAVLGCGAMRRHDAETAEMKRVYLVPAGRGQGAGLALVEAILAAARKACYRRMVLDTLPELAEAQALYRRLGFREIAPYYHNPAPGVVYLGLEL